MTVLEMKEALKCAEDYLSVTVVIGDTEFQVVEVKVEFNPKRTVVLEIGNE